MTLWPCIRLLPLLYGIVALGYKRTNKEISEDANRLAHKMALKLKYTDEHGILHIDMSPSSSPRLDGNPHRETSGHRSGHEPKTELTDPKFDTINHRFGQYDLFGGKYDVDSGKYDVDSRKYDIDGGVADTPRSLFRSRYNSVEEELANTPYAFATERSMRRSAAHTPLLDITIDSCAASDAASPSKDLLDDRFFNRKVDAEYTGLFGPEVDYASKSSAKSDEEENGFTLTQLAHAQDRYYDLSARTKASTGLSGVRPSKPGNVGTVNSYRDSFEVRSAPNERTVEINERFRAGPAGGRDEAFQVLPERTAVRVPEEPATLPVTLPAKKKKESSFAILAERPVAVSSRPTSPRSLPVDVRTGRVSPFRGRGFREETSRHSTPKASAANSRSTSPVRRRTCSLSKIDNMGETAVLSPSIHLISGPHSPRNFIKENIEDIRGISEINRERNKTEAERLRKEEEEALLIEMGVLEKTSKSDGVRSVGGSRTTSRSNSPGKIKLRSRSNSPGTALNKESTKARSKEFINKNDGLSKPAVHKSRVRSVSKSQPQSSTGSPTHTKIPKRQTSVSPPRVINKRSIYHYRKPSESSLNNQRFISNSVSSIHEIIKVGSTAHDKRASRSTQNLTISPTHIRGKPPISPGRGGPPPVNRTLSTKRLSPIVGTPSKSPIEDQKPKTARVPAKPLTNARKPIRTAGNTPATSRINSRQPSKNASRDPSPEKRKPISKPTTTTTRTTKPDNKPVIRSQSTKTTQKPPIVNRTEPKKPISRTNSVKSLARTPSSKSLLEKPPLLKKRDSKTNLKEKTNSSNKINEIGTNKSGEKSAQNPEEKTPVKKEQKKVQKTEAAETASEKAEVITQDSETQYDKVSNDKGELVILTKKNIISMTTAAITAQPLEVVTKVTNQLPAAFEKARERGVFERLSSKDSLAPKEELATSTNDNKTENDEKNKDEIKEKKAHDKPAKSENMNMMLSKEAIQTMDKKEDTDHSNTEVDKTSKHGKPFEHKTIFIEDNIKLKPLQPPYNNPQVERAMQKIDNIMRSPEISPANILEAKKENKDSKNTFKSLADRTKNDVKKSKDDAASKLTQLKEQVVKQNEKPAAEIRKEAMKIDDNFITPIEEPKGVSEKVKDNSLTNKITDIKTIEPIIMVVNEKKTNGINKKEVEKMTETLVKGEPDVEVQSSNVSTPALDKMAGGKKMSSTKKTDGSVSDNSVHSNGGFPHSTSTTPKPPPRSHRGASPKSPDRSAQTTSGDPHTKPPNICQRIINKCKAKCCACCVKSDEETAGEEARKVDPVADMKAAEEGKRGTMSKLNCCGKAKDVEEQAKDVESAAVKAATVEFESETRRPRRWRHALCPCGRGRRVSDVTGAGAGAAARRADAAPEAAPPGCCGRARSRRDSIVSERTPRSCCEWLRAACRRRSEPPSSRQNSVFSKNKSLSPMLPPEDNRPKLDTTLVEHTSVIRGAVPILPVVLAYFCLVCNVVVPGLGTIFSGMFCLCFGIPRFGVHDGAKHRIGSFVINLLVGCGQLFTVLFCLVGWGWSIWWGVIMVKTSRKYRKLKAEAAAEEAEAAPPVIDNNHAGN